MIKLLILLLIVVPCFGKSLLKHEVEQNEFVLYLPDLEKKFQDLIANKDNCSLENYRKMEEIITEFYVWMHFQRSVETVEMLNTMTEKFHSAEGLQSKKYYQIENVLKDEDEVTEKEVFKELNDWRNRTCFTGIKNEIPKN